MPLRKFLPLLLLFLLIFPSLGQAVQLGEKLKPFTLQDMSGRTVDMSTVIGKKPVMLIFWASWCPNCITEVPKINKLVEEYEKQGMKFIGINIGHNDSVKRARKFMKKTGMKYPVIFDSSHSITRKYMIYGVPTILVADSNGIVQFRNYGTPDITTANFNRLKSGN